MVDGIAKLTLCADAVDTLFEYSPAEWAFLHSPMALVAMCFFTAYTGVKIRFDASANKTISFAVAFRGQMSFQ